MAIRSCSLPAGKMLGYTDDILQTDVAWQIGIQPETLSRWLRDPKLRYAYTVAAYTLDQNKCVNPTPDSIDVSASEQDLRTVFEDSRFTSDAMAFAQAREVQAGKYRKD